MCGILGIYDQTPIENFESACCTLLQRIHYRGPDDEGTLFLNPDGHAWKQNGPCLFMGHKRLSIIDLSESGHQPMSNEDKTLWIVFNGEIYNYLEIRQELLTHGHCFSSNTDTEVILHGYETWGIEVLDRLRGMFAFCIYDVKARKLFVARDRMGQKPLIYSKSRGLYAFSSELKSLYSYPRIINEISAKSIHYFLTYQYIPHKYTIFKDIYKLLPAHYAIFDITKDTLVQRRYWRPSFYIHDAPASRESVKGHVEELDALLGESVRLRLRSDVPLGVFLSGGVDSSAITYYAAKQVSSPPNTFSISFTEQEFDESRFAQMVARSLNTHHHTYTVLSEGLNLLPELVWYYNEPFGDSSMIPTYYVSRVTSENVKVVLSGDGGDEVFLGYNRYLLYIALKNVQKFLRILPIGMMRSFFRYLSLVQLTGRYPGMLYNFFSRVQSKKILNYANYVTIINDSLKEELYTPSFKELAHPTKAMGLVDRLFHAVSKKGTKQAFSHVDFLTYLPGDILTKIDIASMANSLECRSPFLDHKVVEFACQLPPDEKLAYLKGKKILKKCIRGKIPKETINRRKMGFGVPINRWFQEKRWNVFLRDTLLSRKHAQRGYFRPEIVQKLIEEHVKGVQDRSAILWQLLVLELWHQTFLQKEPKPLTIT